MGRSLGDHRTAGTIGRKNQGEVHAPQKSKGGCATGEKSSLTDCDNLHRAPAF
jgi:hypothetical protein